MDFLTILFCVIAVALVAALVFLMTVGRRKRESLKLIEAAAERAKARNDERAFADTEPEHDPYRSGIDFNRGLHVHVDDRFDGRGELDGIQMQTISLIFDGFAPAPVQASKNIVTSGAQRRAGVPFSQSIFGADNQLVGEEDQWLNTAGGRL